MKNNTSCQKITQEIKKSHDCVECTHCTKSKILEDRSIEFKCILSKKGFMENTPLIFTLEI